MNDAGARRAPPHGRDRPARRASLFRGLTFQLFVITILPLTGLLLVITFGSLELHQEAMRTLVGERDMLAVHTAAAALQQQVQQRSGTLRLIAPQAAGGDLDALMQRYEFLQQDFDRGLGVLSADGVLRAAYGSPPFWEMLAGQTGELLAELRSGADPLVLPNRFYDPQTGELVVVFLTQAPGGEQMLIGAVTAAGLARRVFNGPMLDSHQTSFLLVSADGRPIFQAGSLAGETPAGDHSGVSEALRGESGATFQRAGDGEHVVAYSPAPGLGWGLISEEPWEMVDSPTLRATQSAPLILVPALFLALLALGFAMRQIVRPLQDLQERAGALARGNFEAIKYPVGGIDEIRRLQAGLVNMAQQVQAAEQTLHGYIAAITSAQEDERRRMARELHDDTIQTLIALKQRVDLARMELQTVEASAQLNEIAGLTEGAIENLRRLTRALRPIYLEDLGLAAALEMLARETGQAAGIAIHFERSGAARRLAPEVELALYRIAQEALSNVARHAGASVAGVRLAFDAASVTLEVRDDGRGFAIPANPGEYARSGHYGLLGMRERADLIGARLDLRSSPGEGAVLRVTLAA